MSDVKTYAAEGWSLVPIPKGEKGPRLSNWQHTTFSESDFKDSDNIGVKLGEPSGGLTDVDLDCKQAIEIAATLLPKTQRIHGRPSKRRSHYWYTVAGLIKSEGFKDLDGSMLVEIRSTGGQTVLPPSVHPSGEVLEWELDKAPLSTDPSLLRDSVVWVATASLLARHYPEAGSRHDAAGQIAGFLLNLKVPPIVVASIVEAAATAAGDPEVRDRVAFAQSTVAAFLANEPVTGGPKLSDLIGAEVIKRIKIWFGTSVSQIQELNERHAIVFGQNGGLIVLTETLEDGAFQLRFSQPNVMPMLYPKMVTIGESPKGKPVTRALGSVWLTHPKRRFYHGIELAPNGNANPGYYNLWRGFTVEPKKGSWPLFKEHLKLLAGSDLECARYIFAWMAETVQHPDRPIGIALSFKGEQGTGKCLAPGTPVIAADGSIRAVESFRVGDQVMGPDSRPRTVMGTTSGRAIMYRITPVKGEPFVCNGAHVLSLRVSGVDARKKYGEYVHISVDDYLKTSYTFKNRAKLWQTGIELPSRPTEFPAYLIGAWLGDGSCDSPRFTLDEKKLAIAEWIEDWCKTSGYFFHEPSQPYLFNLVTRIGSGISVNPFLNYIRKSCVIAGEKRIPREFLFNDRATRLAMLAGLIDTDGYYDGSCYTIASKYPDLAEDIVYLSRSLGFLVSSREKMVTLDGVTRPYQMVTISGHLDDVPCLTLHRQATPRLQRKEVGVTGFSVEHLGEGDYAGFELDGDHLFLLGDFTISHNSTFCKWFGSLFGVHFMHLDSEQRLLGNFNAHLHNVIVVLADEAVWAGGKAGLGSLKRMITEETLAIERKGVDTMVVKNRMHMMVASNEDWFVPVGFDNRRFAVFCTSVAKQNNSEFFSAVRRELFEQGGLSALLYDLLEFKEPVELRDIPQTKELDEQKYRSMHPREAWWYDVLCDGSPWKDADPVNNKEYAIDPDALYAEYVVAMQRAAGRSNLGVKGALGRFLRQVMPNPYPLSRQSSSGDRKRFWVFPSLRDCRNFFAQKFWKKNWSTGSFENFRVEEEPTTEDLYE